MQLDRKLKDELTVFSLAVTFGTMLYYSIEHRPQNSYAHSFLIIGLALNGYLLYKALKKLWHRKWKRIFFDTVIKIFRAVSKRAAVIFDKLYASKKFGSGVISGKTTVLFDIPKYDEKSNKKPKTLKWKNMHTDREKLGFLYYRMITQKLKNGIKIKACDTPSELKRMYTADEAEERIFTLYIDHRYDERTIIPQNELLTLKEKKY